MSTQEPSGALGQGRLPGAQRRAQILLAAKEVFAQQGPSAGMGHIAKACDITRTVLYHYYPTKADLYKAVVTEQMTGLFQHLAEAKNVEGDLGDQAKALISLTVGFAEAEPQAWEILLSEQAVTGNPEIDDLREYAWESMRVAAFDFFNADLETAGLDPMSDWGNAAAEIIRGAFVQLVRWWRKHPEVPRSTIEKSLFHSIWLGTERQANAFVAGRRAAAAPAAGED